MYVMHGPRQVDGVQRYLGFASARDAAAARRAVRSDPAMWDAIGPDAIVDRDGGRWRYITGSDADCARLVRAVREARS